MFGNALLIAGIGILTMIPLSFAVAVLSKRTGEDFLGSVLKTIVVNGGLGVVYYLIFIKAGVPYDPWQTLLTAGSAIVAALISNVVVFVFRR